MTIALYATIWIALTLLAAGAVGARAGAPSRWTRAAYAIGAFLAIAHTAIALGAVYHWDHALAVRETARQAGDVYGFAWRGSIYVSYAFLLVWAAAAWRSQTITHSPVVRMFFLIIIINAAIVFASAPGRVAGLILVAALVWAWWPRPASRV
jgi:hypothetical protein